MADIFITKFYLNITIFTFICYIYFMVMIDVPMYIRMHSEDLKAGKKFNTILQGLLLSMNCDVIEYKWSSWAEEAYWQTPYFAMMVWASQVMAHQPWIYTVNPANRSMSIRTIPNVSGLVKENEKRKDSGEEKEINNKKMK